MILDEHFREKAGHPVLIWDANGVELEYVKWANTETGEVAKLLTDENFILGDPETDETIVETVRVPAPLSYKIVPGATRKLKGFKYRGCICTWARLVGCPACDVAKKNGFN